MRRNNLRKWAILFPLLLLLAVNCSGAPIPQINVRSAAVGTKTASEVQTTVKPIQFIMEYDIDDGSSINTRPDHGWWPLNPEYPNDPSSADTGIYRVTTPLLGTYDSTDVKVQMQHLYWMSALGCSGLQVDFTNCRSLKESGQSSGMRVYYSGVFRAYKALLSTISQAAQFTAPTAYPMIRLNGSEYDNLKLMLDDMYSIYTAHPNSWYKLRDGSADQDKPFIVIFADWNLLQTWAAAGKVPFTDSRFNIRWSNGYLAGVKGATFLNSSGDRVVKKDMPYWLFVENEKMPGKDGYYRPVYTTNAATGQPEQMATWASVSLSGTSWDGLLDKKDGKYTIERYTEPVFRIRPQVLLINRWNYPIAYMTQPQEGISRNDSTHIEPNVDWGFEVFNLVANQTYSLNGWAESAPPAPEVQNVDITANVLEISLKGNPLEYRISTNADFSGADWTYFNINTDGIPIPSGVTGTQTLYIQTRNAFGASAVATYPKQANASSSGNPQSSSPAQGGTGSSSALPVSSAASSASAASSLEASEASVPVSSAPSQAAGSSEPASSLSVSSSGSVSQAASSSATAGSEKISSAGAFSSGDSVLSVASVESENAAASETVSEASSERVGAAASGTARTNPSTGGNAVSFGSLATLLAASAAAVLWKKKRK